MGLTIYAVLAILALATFFALMFLSKDDKNRVFIQYILLAYPLMAMDLFPSFISMTSFDLLTFIFFFAFYRPKMKRLKNGYNYLFLFLLILVVASIGAAYAETLTKDTITAFIQLVSIFIFAKIVIDECLEDDSFCYTIISCIKITLTVSLAFLVCQFIFGVGFSIAKSQNINVLGGESTRYTSFFQDPQKYSQFLAAASFLFLIKDKEGSPIPTVNYILILLSLVAILFTGGRAGFGGWCLGMGILLFFGKSNYRCAAITIGGALYLLVYNFEDSFPIFKRASLSDSYEFRYAIWEDAFAIFMKHPFAGIGIGNYANYVSAHNPDQYWFSDNEITWFDHPESGYLKFLTDR
jgi:O-antigen ligase